MARRGRVVPGELRLGAARPAIGVPAVPWTAGARGCTDHHRRGSASRILGTPRAVACPLAFWQDIWPRIRRRSTCSKARQRLAHQQHRASGNPGCLDLQESGQVTLTLR